MALAYLFGSLLLGVGPGVVVYCFYLLRKPLLVLLSLASAFFWLCTLFAVACVFRGFVPLSASAGPYAALLFVGAASQEGFRIGVYWVHKRMTASLADVAVTMGLPHLTSSDHRELALGHGMGHGFAHSIFFFISFLQLAAGDGTYYIQTCPHISFFVASALNSLAFLLLHSFGMVVAFEGLQTKNRFLTGLVPTLHLIATLLTLGNFASDGCLWVIPTNLAISIVPVALCGRIVWQDVKSAPLIREDTGVGGDSEGASGPSQSGPIDD
mmetsp:Transcript_20034/g.35707  ORF Transcript_20034/g.35707 Transcript_20034/m.35707 type:complete len:269 (-) Transcript_20034:151-957(-)